MLFLVVRSLCPSLDWFQLFHPQEHLRNEPRKGFSMPWENRTYATKKQVKSIPGIPDQWDIILRLCSSPHFFLSGKTCPSPTLPPNVCVCVCRYICIYIYIYICTHNSYRLLAKWVGNWKLTKNGVGYTKLWGINKIEEAGRDHIVAQR